MAEKRNPYHILGVSAGADKATIEAAYRQLARRYHPDLNPEQNTTARMQDINWARDVLLDPRARYTWHQRNRTDRRPYARNRATTSTRTQAHTHARPHAYTHTRTRSYTHNTGTRSQDNRQQQGQRTTTSSPPRSTPPRRRPRPHESRQSNGCSIWIILMLVSNLFGSILSDSLSSSTSNKSPVTYTITTPNPQVATASYATPDLAINWQAMQSLTTGEYVMTIRNEGQRRYVDYVLTGEHKQVDVEVGGTLYWRDNTPQVITYCAPGVSAIRYAPNGCRFLLLSRNPLFTPDDPP